MSHSQPASENIRVHVFVSGRVQGVGYRAATADTASSLGLNGWVRNLPDGRVEAVFEGPAAQVEEMLSWCHRGPRFAAVREVTTTYERLERLQGFRITR